jgi:hypothetical protein
MISKMVSAVLVIMLLHGSIAAQGQLESQHQPAAKMQESLSKAEKRDKTVVIHLTDGTKVAGKISDISERGFALTDQKTRITKSYVYADVREVRQKGLSMAAGILIGIGIAVGVTVGMFYALYPKT